MIPVGCIGISASVLPASSQPSCFESHVFVGKLLWVHVPVDGKVFVCVPNTAQLDDVCESGFDNSLFKRVSGIIIVNFKEQKTLIHLLREHPIHVSSSLKSMSSQFHLCCLCVEDDVLDAQKTTITQFHGLILFDSPAQMLQSLLSQKWENDCRIPCFDFLCPGRLSPALLLSCVSEISILDLQ